MSKRHLIRQWFRAKTTKRGDKIPLSLDVMRDADISKMFEVLDITNAAALRQ